MATSVTHKRNHYTLTSLLLFLALFLLSIFLFTRRALQPDLFVRPSSSSSIDDSGIPFTDATERIVDSSSNQSALSNVHTEPIEPNSASGSTRDDISDNEKKSDPVSDGTDSEVSESDDKNDLDSKDESAGNVRDNVVSAIGKNDVVSDSEGEMVDNGVDDKMSKCDLYTGTWVKDENYPIYRPGSCPYVDEAYDCQINGRTDEEYTKWRWKPDDCDLPRFNATDFLERLRGKNLMLVGDSMNRNQFESILCVLREGLHNKSKMYETHGWRITKGRGYYVFKFEDYNCTVQFVRSHFLVKEGIRTNAQGNSNPTLSIDQIDKTSGRWKRADILVFNTGHWWTHGKTARGINYYKEGDYLYPQFDAVEAYRRALKTWAYWIDHNIDPKKQIVYYRGYSTAHFRGGDWDSGGSCRGETEPIFTGTILDEYPVKMKIVEEVIKGMKVPVKLLNVTRLTNFRKDGHPSIYGKLAGAGKTVSTKRQDCSHWCLPGVPDTWNELIYATLVRRQTRSTT